VVASLRRQANATAGIDRFQLLAKREADDVERVVGASDDSRCSPKVVEFGTQTASRDENSWFLLWQRKVEKPKNSNKYKKLES
jgi:hypothetical protein